MKWILRMKTLMKMHQYKRKLLTSLVIKPTRKLKKIKSLKLTNTKKSKNREKLKELQN